MTLTKGELYPATKSEPVNVNILTAGVLLSPEPPGPVNNTVVAAGKAESTPTLKLAVYPLTVAGKVMAPTVPPPKVPEGKLKLNWRLKFGPKSARTKRVAVKVTEQVKLGAESQLLQSRKVVPAVGDEPERVAAVTPTPVPLL